MEIENIQKHIITELVNSLDNYMSPTPGRYRIRSLSEPKFLSRTNTYEDVQEYVRLWNLYYSSRLEVFDFLYNDMATRFYNLSKKIDDMDYIIEYNESSLNVEVNDNCITLKKYKLNETISSDYFFMPDPDYIMDGYIAYKFKPHVEDIIEVYQVWEHNLDYVLSNGTMLDENLNITTNIDVVKYVGFPLKQSGYCVIDNQVYYSYKYESYKELYQEVDPEFGYFIKDFEISPKMKFDIFGSGFVSAELLDEENKVPVPISGIITERPVNIQTIGAYNVLYFSYPIVKIVDMFPSIHIISTIDNIIITPNGDSETLIKYIPSLVSNVNEKGLVTTISPFTWIPDTSGYQRISLTEISSYFDLSKNLNKFTNTGMALSGYVTDWLSIDLLSMQPLRIDLPQTRDDLVGIPINVKYQWQADKTISTNPRPVISTIVKDYDLEKLDDEPIFIRIPSMKSRYDNTLNATIVDYSKFNDWGFYPFVYKTIAFNLIETPVNLMSEDQMYNSVVTQLFDGIDYQTRTIDDFLYRLKIYYTEINKYMKIKITLYKTDNDQTPYVYFGSIKNLDNNKNSYSLTAADFIRNDIPIESSIIVSPPPPPLTSPSGSST